MAKKRREQGQGVDQDEGAARQGPAIKEIDRIKREKATAEKKERERLRRNREGQGGEEGARWSARGQIGRRRLQSQHRPE